MRISKKYVKETMQELIQKIKAINQQIEQNKKAIEDDDAHLTKEKIGSAKKEQPAVIPPVPTVEKTMAPKMPIEAAPKGRDVFDEKDAPRAKPAAPEKTPASPKPSKSKMEFME